MVQDDVGYGDFVLNDDANAFKLTLNQFHQLFAKIFATKQT